MSEQASSRPIEQFNVRDQDMIRKIDAALSGYPPIAPLRTEQQLNLSDSTTVLSDHSPHTRHGTFTIGSTALEAESDLLN